MQELPLAQDFGCLELVLDGVRVLAEQHLLILLTNERKTLLVLDQ